MDILAGLLKLFDLRGLLLFTAVFVPIEQIFSLHRSQKVFRKQFLTDLLYVIINPLPIALGLAALTLWVVGSLSGVVPGAIPNAIRSQPLVVQLLEALVIGDVGIYLAHRAFHEIPFLWKFHEIHHSAEAMDWIVSFRAHAVDQIVSSAARNIPLFLLGYSDAAIGLYLLIFSWHSLLAHANIKMNWGIFNWLIVSPQFHHWHHANERNSYNRNYAAIFPLMDMIGGTLQMPQKDEYPQQYGVDTPVASGYFAQFIGPFLPRRLRLRLGRRPTESAPGP